MNAAFVDTSCLAAIALGEKESTSLSNRLAEFDKRFASNLLEAELRAAMHRENVTPTPGLLDGIDWVIPVRPLHDEINRVLGAGYLRGADCWHLATALYIADEPSRIAFLTLDEPQRKVARALGFKT